jgi:aminoglycoside phosphotransferase (APT) family kinase protein
LERELETTSPFDVRLIAGGHSNLTYGVRSGDGRRWVLRRPPFGEILESAHDVVREHRILRAMARTSVPVPPVVAVCEDAAVIGAPFYVMEFVDGLVLRDAETVQRSLTMEARRTLGFALADTLADIHAADVDAIGLGDLSRPTGYVDRQLRRWSRQVAGSRGGTRDVSVLDKVHAALSAQRVDDVGGVVVHGDYRLDNCLVGEAGDVRAVLDWELCTLGHPLADVGLLVVYWAEPGDDLHPLPGNPTEAGGFPTRLEIVARYAERSGRDVSNIDFYIAFAYWRLACILEGVHARYAARAPGPAGPAASEARDFATRATAMGAAAAGITASW